MAGTARPHRHCGRVPGHGVSASTVLNPGVILRQVLGMVANFCAENNETSVVLMGYANPIEAMGVDAFAAAAFDTDVVRPCDECQRT